MYSIIFKLYKELPELLDFPNIDHFVEYIFVHLVKKCADDPGKVSALQPMAVLRGFLKQHPDLDCMVAINTFKKIINSSFLSKYILLLGTSAYGAYQFRANKMTNELRSHINKIYNLALWTHIDLINVRLSLGSIYNHEYSSFLDDILRVIKKAGTLSFHIEPFVGKVCIVRLVERFKKRLPHLSLPEYTDSPITISGLDLAISFLIKNNLVENSSNTMSAMDLSLTETGIKYVEYIKNR